MTTLLGGFRRDRRGAVLPMFAVVLLPILLAAGSAIDYGRVIESRTQLQSGLDAGVLAAAKINGVDATSARATIEQLLDANFGGAMAWTLEDPVVTGTTVTARARISVPTTFMMLAGISTLDVDLSAQALRPQGRTEVALVLDNTGSMASGDRIGALRTAALKLVDILEASRNEPTDLKISVVPFVTAVNIKAPGAFSTSWIDTTGVSKHNGEGMTGNQATRNHWSIFQELEAFEPQWAWKGCVEARPIDYALKDTPPSASIPDTLFVPYLWPDEPDIPTTTDKGVTVSSYDNSYLVDHNNGNVENRQRHVEKYRSSQTKVAQKPSPAAKPNNTHGPNKSCGQPVLPLTTDMAAVRAALNAMRPWDDSGTNVSEGIMWGLRMLSPEEPFTEGAAWSDATVDKVLLVLTDGANVIYNGDTGYADKSHNKSQYTSWGYVAAGRFEGATTISAARNAVDRFTTTACNEVKAKNIKVYAITFMVNDATAKTLFTNCADTGNYFDSPSTTALEGIFASIAREITPIRLAK